MEKDSPNDSGQTAAPAVSLSEADVLLWDAIPALKLNIAQTAALCGISVRQLGYWTKQGYVNAAGRGARRLYGPDSLRRILAIRKAMLAGASLRQALRSLSSDASVTIGTRPRGREGLVPTSLGNGSDSGPSLSSEAAGQLATGLLALFDGNRMTRDDAVGLSIKVGWPAEYVRLVAEQLCVSGHLVKTVVQGDAIFCWAKDGAIPC